MVIPGCPRFLRHVRWCPMETKPELKVLAQAIRRRRSELGLTQREVIAATESATHPPVTPDTFTRWENGYSAPTGPNAFKLDAALRWEPGTTVALRDGDDIPSQSPTTLNGDSPDSASLADRITSPGIPGRRSASHYPHPFPPVTRVTAEAPGQVSGRGLLLFNCFLRLTAVLPTV